MKRARFNFVLVGLSFNLGAAVGAAMGGLLGSEMWLEANLVAGGVPFVVALWAAVTEDTTEDKELLAKWAKKRSAAATPSPRDESSADTAL